MPINNNKNNINIYLYFGEDDFTVAEKLREKKKSFEKKFGDINICEINWQNVYVKEEEKISLLQNSLMANSLFSFSKLLIFKGILFSQTGSLGRESGPNKNQENSSPSKEGNKKRSRKEEIILKYLDNPQGNIEVFFIEKNFPDKRGSIYKRILELKSKNLAEVAEFSTPAGFQFDNWIKKRVEKLGGKISQEAVNAFAVCLGKGFSQRDKKKKIIQSFDLWEANNEIEKLLSYCWNREITKADVELLVESKVDMNIFRLIDGISLRNKSQAALLLNSQIEKGLSENYILTMLAYQFRNLLKVKSLLNQGMFSSEVAAETGMHPFIVQKSVQQCRNFEIAKLKKIYKKLYDADVAIKTGKIDPRLALDLLVVSI